MKRKINLFLLMFLFVPCLLFMVSCGSQPVKFDIKFMVDGKTYATVETGGNETISMPENPTKEGYDFDGWYWDKDVWTEPFTANSLLNAPLSSDMKVYAKFSVSHKHTLTKVNKKFATCTENGYEEYWICACGKMFSDENGNVEINKINTISATGHNFGEWYEVVPASYTSKGLGRRDCSKCDYYETRNIPELIAAIVEPTKVDVEFGIIKWDGSSPYGFDVIVNNHSYEIFGNSLDVNLKSDDYNSVSVACIYKDNTKSNYVSLENFVVNQPISNLHFMDDGTNISFTWDSLSDLYDYTFVLNGKETTISKTNKTYTISRNSVSNGSMISVYVNGIESDSFLPSRKTTIKLKQLEAPNLSINKLDMVWNDVQNSEYYSVIGLTNLKTTDTKYSCDGVSSGNHTITVEVYGKDYLFNSSTLTFKKLIKPDISIDEGVVSWDAIAGQLRYATLYNDIETKFSANSFELKNIDTEYDLYLYASPVQPNTMQSDRVIIKQFVYNEYSNIYCGNIVNNVITFNSIMPSGNIIYIPESCQNVDFSNINYQELTLITNKHPKLLNSSSNIKVIVPNNVTSIKKDAFSGCSGLMSITIPESVINIGENAFSGCNGLTSIIIPNSVTSIGKGAFSGCSSLKEISIPFVGGSVSDCTYLGYIFGATSYLKNLDCVPDSLKKVIVTGTIIEENAFYGCSELTSIIISDNVTSIGSSAFYGCRGLEEVHISSLESWFNIDFTDSSNPLRNAHHLYLNGEELTEIVIPSSVTNVKRYVLDGASSITSIIVPENTTYFEPNAFYNCSIKKVNILSLESWFNIYFGNSESNPLRYAHHLYLNGEELTEIIIPDSITKINNYALYGASLITSITIPNSVVSISIEAFENCNVLKEVHISSLESWLNIDFTDLSNPLRSAHHLYLNGEELTEIAIPSSVTNVKKYAFDGASSITSITIPESVISIGVSTFRDCSSIKEVNISSLESWLKISFSDSHSNPLRYAHHLYLDGKELTEITVPNSITKINNYALYGASSVTSITLPNSVTNIGFGALLNCSSLEEITIPFVGGSVYYNTYLGYLFGADSDYYVSPYVPKTLRRVNIIGGTSIGNNAFYGCSGLTSIIMPDNVKSIRESAFYGCTGLTSITIPDSVTSIGSSAFYGCTKLTSIIIPKNVISIGDYAFACCSGLTSITVPDSVISVGKYAFYSCSALKELTIPFVGGSVSKNAYLGYIFGASSSSNNSDYVPNSLYKVILTGGTSIGYQAFYKCKGLTSITIPDSATSIENNAFYGCTGLRSITLPNSVTNIGFGALLNCSSLEEITIPFVGGSVSKNTYFGYIFGKPSYATDTIYVPKSLEKVIVTGGTSIGESAFYGCNNIKSIIIPDSVTSIGDCAFNKCYWLTSITIPYSVISIGQSAFSECTGLTSISIPNSVTSIGYRAFYECSSLTTITIPGSVTSIGDRVFNNCSRLISILVDENPYYQSLGNCLIDKVNKKLIAGCNTSVIPDDGSVTSISSYAFSGCSGLVSITIPDSVTSIGNGTFSGCSGLTTITIPDGVTSIGSSAFYGCTKLTSIIIPESVINIDYSAFAKCTNLSIYCEATSQQTGWVSNWNPSDCLVYWYRKTQPMGEKEKYWHYDEDGETILIW